MCIENETEVQNKLAIKIIAHYIYFIENEMHKNVVGVKIGLLYKFIA